MAVVDGRGLPIGIRVYSASPHEVKLAEETVKSIPVKKKLERIIGDRAYSSKPLSERLFAWLNNFWRLPIRHERHVENYFGFLLLACIRILLRST